MLSIPFFGAAQSHLAQEITHPKETPHTKKDAIAISRESVPLLKAWGGEKLLLKQFFGEEGDLWIWHMFANRCRVPAHHPQA